MGVTQTRRKPKCSRNAASAMGPPSPTNTRVLRSHTAKVPAIADTTSKVTKPKKRRTRADPWTPKRKPKRNPRPRVPPPSHFTCRICIEEQPVNQFIRWVPLTRRWTLPLDVPHNCIAHLARDPRRKHIDPVCKSCIGNSMSARLDRLGARRVFVGCLEPGCEEPWSHDFITRYMPQGETLEKFNMEMFDVWKADTFPKPITCFAPTCSAVGLPDAMAPGYPQVACNTCSLRSCAQCHVPWHDGLSCAEYQARNIDEQLSDAEKDTLKLMQTRDGRRCPNCALVIEKDGGCASMHCTGCNKYFNWESAASAVAGTRKALPHFSNNVPYWEPPEPTTCEMDALLANESGKAVPAATTAASA